MVETPAISVCRGGICKPGNIALIPLEPAVPIIPTSLINKQRKNGIEVPQHLTPALSYFIGLLRDGNLSKNHRNFHVRIFSKNKEFLQNVVNVIAEAIFKKKVRILNSGEDYVWQLNSKALYYLIVAVFDYPEGKTQKWWRIPNIIMRSPQEIQKWYIAGFTDAEGSVCIENGEPIIYIYQSWNNPYECPPLEDLKRILIDLGINSIGPMLYKKHVNAFKLKIKGNNAKKFLQTIPLLLKFKV